MSETLAHTVRKLGLFCLVATALALAASIPLGCVPVALRIGGFSLADGAGLGFALAMVTRTRRPWLIYLGLALGALTFAPLMLEWPPGDAWDIHPWHGAPPIVYNYLDVLRTALYLVGLPWPFARFGYHAPDPLPTLPPPIEEGEAQDLEDSEKP
jgi:hypothetical protein